MDAKTAWTWAGSNVGMFDDCGASRSPLFSDVDDFNSVEESAFVAVIPKTHISYFPHGVRKNMIYSINYQREIMIAYDFTSDVYHFFLPEGKSITPQNTHNATATA